MAVSGHIWDSGPQHSYVLSSADFVLCEEGFDAARDLFPVRLESKMSSIEQVRFNILQIAAVGGGAFRWKDQIVLAPHVATLVMISPLNFASIDKSACLLTATSRTLGQSVAMHCSDKPLRRLQV